MNKQFMFCIVLQDINLWSLIMMTKLFQLKNEKVAQALPAIAAVQLSG